MIMIGYFKIADLSCVIDPIEAGAAWLWEIVVMGGRLDVELGRQVRVAGGGGRQLIEHVVVALRLGLVGDPRLLQEVILAEIHVNTGVETRKVFWEVFCCTKYIFG